MWSFLVVTKPSCYISLKLKLQNDVIQTKMYQWMLEESTLFQHLCILTSLPPCAYSQTSITTMQLNQTDTEPALYFLFFLTHSAGFVGASEDAAGKWSEFHVTWLFCAMSVFVSLFLKGLLQKVLRTTNMMLNEVFSLHTSNQAFKKHYFLTTKAWP